MIRKIKGSLFAKVFLITATLLLGVSLFVYGILAFIMPKTYSSELNSLLDAKTEEFVRELENETFSASGGLFDQFLQNADISYMELYTGEGRQVALPTAGNQAAAGYALENTAVSSSGGGEPILSSSYYFSFRDSDARYMLAVYGAAGQVDELRQSFLMLLPILLCVILVVSLIASWLYSRIITKPVLEISRISEKMSGLQLDWQVDEHRSDELGVLGKSLNMLSQNLSAALTGLQNANEKLAADIEHERELEQARTDFFSAVSHELKTPVTIIKGQLEGMLLGIGAYKDREKYLKRSLEITNTLETMVQEILTVSRLEAAGADFKKERLDCAQIIKSYLRETEDLITGKDLRIYLDIQEDASVNGNRMLMEKVFSNLIGNAVKYAPPGATVCISAVKAHGQTEFSVENTGTHIPEDSIPKIFDAFYRVEQSRSRKTGGSGLGLYVVQEILRRHGSACTACNTRAGIKFSFTI